MKISNIILLLLIFGLFCNCNEKQKTIETPKKRIANVKSAYIKSDNVNASAKLKSDKIVGRYYVENFYHYLDRGFELKIKKPKDDFMLYTFEFKDNGEIIFKDLTEFYDCGIGILSIDKGYWKAKGNEIYTLTFDGEYALESTFHTESEYTMVELKNGSIKMKLNKVIVNKSQRAW